MSDLAGAMERGVQQELLPVIQDVEKTLTQSFHSVAQGAEGVAGRTEQAEADAAAKIAAVGAKGDAGSAADPGALRQRLTDIMDPAKGPGAHQIAMFGDAHTGDVSTAANEATFWSGATKLEAGENAAWPGAKTITTPAGDRLLLAGEDNAKTIARANGKVSLESLLEDRGIAMPRWSDDAAVQQQWKDISDRYAQGVSGDVHVVLGDSLRPGNIWETVEYPRLTANPNVSSITKVDLKTLEETLLWKRGGP